MTTYLAPIDKPEGLMLKLGYRYTRRQFGKVPGPLSVFCARMPTAFTSFYGKVSKLDKKLELSADTAALVRERVASTNVCLYCMDANRWAASHKKTENATKFDALDEYRTSPQFSDAERAALDYATELTEDRHVSPDTFAELSQHYSEREICEIVWLVASEHLYNLNNIGLNIGSDGLFEVKGGVAEVVSLVVTRGQRTNGVGEPLLEATERLARDRGIDTMKTAVMRGNARAQGFYESHGYSVGEYVLSAGSAIADESEIQASSPRHPSARRRAAGSWLTTRS